MFFYDTNRVLCDENTIMKWAAPNQNVPEAKNGFVRVYNPVTDQWGYQSSEPGAWAEYLKSIGRLKIADGQKIDSEGKIVFKSESELIADGLLGLEELRVKRINEIERLYSEKTAAGFISGALGPSYRYKSKPENQLDLIGCVAAGITVKFKCTDFAGNNEANREHTATQIKTVLRDGLAAKIFILERYDALIAEVKAALTIEQLQAVSIYTGWEPQI